MSENFILWAFGLLITGLGTGIVILFNWIMKLNNEIKDRVPFKWIEENFTKIYDKKIEDRHSENRIIFNNMNDELKEIKKALIGTMTDDGVISKLKIQRTVLDEMAIRIKKLCETCKYYSENK